MCNAVYRNRQLFVTDDGSPLVFHIPPGQTKKELAPLIVCGGGVVTSKQGPAIKLADKSLGESAGKYTDLFWPFYVLDCVNQNKRLDLEHYRCSTGSRRMQVMADSNDENDMAPARTIINKPHNKKGRLFFSKAEDLKILHYVIENRVLDQTKGKKIWKKMHLLKITMHSAESMRSRFLQKIMKSLDAYDIPSSWKSYLTGDTSVTAQEPPVDIENACLSESTAPRVDKPTDGIKNAREGPTQLVAETQDTQSDVDLNGSCEGTIALACSSSTDCNHDLLHHTVEVDVCIEEYDDFDRNLIELALKSSRESSSRQGCHLPEVNSRDSVSKKQDGAGTCYQKGIDIEKRDRECTDSDKRDRECTDADKGGRERTNADKEDRECTNADKDDRECTNADKGDRECTDADKGGQDCTDADKGGQECTDADKRDQASKVLERRPEGPPEAASTARVNIDDSDLIFDSGKDESSGMQKKQVKGNSPSRLRRRIDFQLEVEKQVSCEKQCTAETSRAGKHKKKLFNPEIHDFSVDVGETASGGTVASDQRKSKSDKAAHTAADSHGQTSRTNMTLRKKTVVLSSEKTTSNSPEKKSQEARTPSKQAAQKRALRRRVVDDVDESVSFESDEESLMGKSMSVTSRAFSEKLPPVLPSPERQRMSKSKHLSASKLLPEKLTAPSLASTPRSSPRNSLTPSKSSAESQRSKSGPQLASKTLVQERQKSKTHSPQKRLRLDSASSSDISEDESYREDKQTVQLLAEEFGLTLSESWHILWWFSGSIIASRYWIMSGRCLRGHYLWRTEDDKAILGEESDSAHLVQLIQQRGQKAIDKRRQWLQDG